MVDRTAPHRIAPATTPAVLGEDHTCWCGPACLIAVLARRRDGNLCWESTGRRVDRVEAVAPCGGECVDDVQAAPALGAEAVVFGVQPAIPEIFGPGLRESGTFRDLLVDHLSALPAAQAWRTGQSDSGGIFQTASRSGGQHARE